MVFCDIFCIFNLMIHKALGDSFPLSKHNVVYIQADTGKNWANIGKWVSGWGNKMLLLAKDYV